MKISEIFGHGVENCSEGATNHRVNKTCPFRKTPCTKSSKIDPLGICSLSDGTNAASLCPVRFLEGDKIFYDAASIAFGMNAKFSIFPEIRILKIDSENENERDRKIGKVDFLLGKIENGQVTDFAALEVQAVYFSGRGIRPSLNYYIEHGHLDPKNSERRPDFRSSAQKRLMPQLQLKVPVFRRWGKKFFVVVDTQFFDALPLFKHTTNSNSELTWLTYPISKNGDDYSMSEVQIVFSEWDDVQTSLREGKPPDPSEIIEELQTKLMNKRGKGPRILST